MGILVVGSVALDSIATPSGEREEILGGSASYFSLAASYFTDVSIVAVIGDDFPGEHVEFFNQKGIDTSGLQRQKGKTFRWKGQYGDDLNTAKTLDTQLNVFASFAPVVRSNHKKLPFLFLGNIDPDLQRHVLAQMERPRVIACDTMNYWIDSKPESLRKTLALVDVLVINDAETRQLAGRKNLVQAAREILTWGPETLVIKRGEYGALMIRKKSIFGVPAFPMDQVCDPTGAGDSFAGGFMGYISASGKDDDGALRKATVFGCVMASFNVSEFGPAGLAELTYTEIEGRYRKFRELTQYDDI
jgi:sugar/nucleoside kinase (ribokinase family)